MTLRDWKVPPPLVAGHMANRKIVENAVKTTAKLSNDDLTKLANTFLKGTAKMKKKNIRKYLEHISTPR